jgi:leucine dehydrogenase
MTLFDSPSFEGHEGIHAFFDEKSGLKCIIAVHSTARGPAAGGCRMWPYPSAEAALDDALRLSRAMSYKNAMADLFEAFGRAVEDVAGKYWTAEDVGVSPADLMHARQSTRFVAGLTGHAAASGDPSPVTAEGIFRGITLGVRRGLNRDLAGVTVAIQGVGHVGAYLADKLHAAGAKLIITDVNEDALRQVAARTGATVVKPNQIFDAEADVFAPCAMGGAVNADTLPRLKVRIIAGGANNQLADADTGRAVYERGMLYLPDYVINGGGIINVAGEIRALDRMEAFDPAWVEMKLGRLMETLDEVLERSKAERRPSDQVANEMAKARISVAAEQKAAA